MTKRTEDTTDTTDTTDTARASYRTQNAPLSAEYTRAIEAWRERGPIARMRHSPELRGADGRPMSQKNFAQLIRYALQTVSNWERGYTHVTTASMREIVIHLFTGPEPQEPVTFSPEEKAVWRRDKLEPWQAEVREKTKVLQEQFERWWAEEPPSPQFSFPRLVGVADDGEPVRPVA